MIGSDSRQLDYLVRNGLILNAQVPPEGSVPERYIPWIEARAQHLGGALTNIAGSIIKESQMVQTSRQTAIDFHKAIGIEYPEYKREGDRIVRIDGEEPTEDVSLFLYKPSEEVHLQFADVMNARVLANPIELNQVGKDILHPGVDEVASFEDLEQRFSTIPGTGIRVLPGLTCYNESEVARAVEIFNQSERGFVIKEAKGSDGSNLTEDPDQIYNYPVVLEQKVDIITTITIDDINGPELIMEERSKDETKRWVGSAYPFEGIDNINQTDLAIIQEQVQETIAEFRELMRNGYGVDPVIFGLDFVVYEENGEIQIAVIDPNIRPTGNMYMNYHREVLTYAGYEVGAMEGVLLYDEDASDCIDAVDLQYTLDELGLSLMEYEEVDAEVVPTGIRTEVHNGVEYPSGVIVVVQDPDESRNGTPMTMLNVIGRDRESTARMVEEVLRFTSSK